MTIEFDQFCLFNLEGLGSFAIYLSNLDVLEFASTKNKNYKIQNFWNFIEEFKLLFSHFAPVQPVEQWLKFDKEKLKLITCLF